MENIWSEPSHFGKVLKTQPLIYKDKGVSNYENGCFWISVFQTMTSPLSLTWYLSLHRSQLVFEKISHVNELQVKNFSLHCRKKWYRNFFVVPKIFIKVKNLVKCNQISQELQSIFEAKISLIALISIKSICAYIKTPVNPKVMMT